MTRRHGDCRIALTFGLPWSRNRRAAGGKRVRLYIWSLRIRPGKRRAYSKEQEVICLQLSSASYEEIGISVDDDAV